MTTPSGGSLTYSAVAASGGVTAWLSVAEGWLGVIVGILTVLVLLVRLICDWPKFIARLRRKGGG